MGMETIAAVLVPGLESLVAPHQSGAFVRDYWQRRPLHVVGAEGRLARLAEIFFDFDVEAILGAADLGRTIVQPPLEEQRRRAAGAAGERLAPAPEVEAMMRMYGLGNQLYVAASGVPGVNEWIEQLSRDLGRIWSEGRGDIYATRGGGGADVHFDKNDNFTVQLRGRKVWFFSIEPAYPLPLHNSGDPGGVPYDATYVFDPGRVDPATLQEVVLRPGDIFYMPRGFLHGTRAEEDSLSFNLSLGAQPWADVLLETLRAYLIREPGLRESAVRAPEAARARVDLFKRLVAGLCSEDVLAAPQAAAPARPGGARLARRRPLSWWSCADRGEGPTVTIEIRTPDRSATAFEISRELLAALRALPEGPEPFDPDELLRASDCDVEGGREFIEELACAGLLGWAAAAHR